ncbi:MAG TPA: PASTA domain-containing protein, partial [Candidatus Avoscillospira stercoripullorum]|nr:PASTA domain-containing protein [Candidatus Avoscillospira stercoripullorum]
KYDVRNGAFGIVMNVNTGEVLGMATLGSYDPNNHQEIYDEELREELERQYQLAISLDEDSQAYTDAMAAYNAAMATARLRQWRNRCVADGYEPGSTFKPITLATGLETGAITLNDTYECTGSYKFEGRDQIVNCWKAAGHGTQTTMEALGNSCNIAFSNMGLKIGAQTFYEYFEAFGFREKTGIDLPGEAEGIFFPYEQFTQAGNNANLISSSWGQTFKITPIQLVRATAALVNGGYLLEPHVVKEVLDSDGNVVSRTETKVIRQVISQETSDIMCQMYEYVVSGGTASGASVPGYRVGGKTGTGEKIDVYDENGVQVDDKMVSFIGIAPMEDPKYVVLVVLDTPSEATGLYISGGIMAAPTGGAILGDILPYLGVEPNYTDEELELVTVSVPNVVDMTEAEAAAALQEKSFTYRTVGSGTTVVDQVPAAGAKIPGKSEVVLYFGEEAPDETVEVPDFSGMTLVYAQQYAKSYGLYLLVTGTNQDRADVTATYQDIAAGTEVATGTTITVEFTNHSAQD